MRQRHNLPSDFAIKKKQNAPPVNQACTAKQLCLVCSTTVVDPAVAVADRKLCQTIKDQWYVVLLRSIRTKELWVKVVSRFQDRQGAPDWLISEAGAHK